MHSIGKLFPEIFVAKHQILLQGGRFMFCLWPQIAQASLFFLPWEATPETQVDEVRRFIARYVN